MEISSSRGLEAIHSNAVTCKEGLGLLITPESLAPEIKWQNAKTPQLVLSPPWKEGLLWEYQTSHSHTSFMLSEGHGGPSGDAFPVSKQRMCQHLLCAPKPHRGWSLMTLVLSLLQGQPHWCMGTHSSATRHKKAQFLRPCHNFMCVESNYPKNARNKGNFFSLLIPLHLSFASVKWQRYTAAHKSEDACCIPHESCKCCVMSHILVRHTRKQAVLLSELSLERGGREKAERFFQVRISKESTD